MYFIFVAQNCITDKMQKHQRFFHELLPIKGCKVQAYSTYEQNVD
jgi:hypothetical protein